MKEWKQSLLRVQEDGMEAIEGLLVITLTLFVLFFHLGLWIFAVPAVCGDTCCR